MLIAAVHHTTKLVHIPMSQINKISFFAQCYDLNSSLFSEIWCFNPRNDSMPTDATPTTHSLIEVDHVRILSMNYNLLLKPKRRYCNKLDIHHLLRNEDKLDVAVVKEGLVMQPFCPYPNQSHRTNRIWIECI